MPKKEQKILFNFSDLEGRIVTKFKTREAFAAHLGMQPSALSNRLKQHIQFRADEILAICQPDCLDIDPQDIQKYFFTPQS